MDRIGTFEEFLPERYPNHQCNEVSLQSRNVWSFSDAFLTASSDLGALPNALQAATNLLDPALSTAQVDAAIEAVLQNLSPEQLGLLLSDLAEAMLEASYKHLRNSSV